MLANDLRHRADNGTINAKNILVAKKVVAIIDGAFAQVIDEVGVYFYFVIVQGLYPFQKLFFLEICREPDLFKIIQPELQLYIIFH